MTMFDLLVIVFILVSLYEIFAKPKETNNKLINNFYKSLVLLENSNKDMMKLIKLNTDRLNTLSILYCEDEKDEK